jgi:hypothetical protein
MPPHDGLGPHDGNSVNDGWAQPIKPYEDQPVDDAQPRPGRCLPAQDRQLMAEDKNLGLQSGPRLEQQGKDACDEFHKADHSSSL